MMARRYLAGELRPFEAILLLRNLVRSDASLLLADDSAVSREYSCFCPNNFYCSNYFVHHRSSRTSRHTDAETCGAVRRCTSHQLSPCVRGRRATPGADYSRSAALFLRIVRKNQGELHHRYGWPGAQPVDPGERRSDRRSPGASDREDLEISSGDLQWCSYRD